MAVKIFDKNKAGVSQLIQSPNTWAIDLWRKGCANHWMPQEVDMSTDIKQWKNNGFITEDEKLLVKRTLGLFAMGESMVSNFWFLLLLCSLIFSCISKSYARPVAM